MIILGLTGPSGSGKSSFAHRALEKYDGVCVTDADKIARSVTEKGTPCLKELCGYFGNGILLADGSLDRKALAKAAFSDEKKHEVLNSVTHKYIMLEMRKEIDNAEKSGMKMCIVDAPLLFESGFDKNCGVTVCVIADKDTRIKRIMQRDGIDENSARLRISAQHDDEFYTSKSGFALRNDTSQADFEKQTDDVLQVIFQKFKA